MIRALLGIPLFFVLLFVPAGRLDWIEGWVFFVTFRAGLLALTLWGARHAPDLAEERRKTFREALGWDKALIATQSTLFLGGLVLAALDAGRFGWSSTPLGLRVAAWFALVLGFVIGWRALAANPYASRLVRIQHERGHRVADAGPYRLVRHPLYVGVILCTLSVPVLLGSWWAVVPCSLVALLSVVRTSIEDRTLEKQLEGYRDYAKRVRYRLVPLIW